MEVDLDALCANLRRVAGSAEVIPMVKADAYGLGAPRVVDAIVAALAPEGPRAFGVATVAEGEALRAGGWAGRIVVFAPIPPGEFRRAGEAGLALAISSLAALRRWSEVAAEVGRALPFHLEIDTGMGRSGLPWAEAGAWGAMVATGASGLRWEGCFTHFHSADEPPSAPTLAQWDRFRRALAQLPPEPPGAPRRVAHAANSAAALRFPAYRAGLVRPGIALYGGAAGSGDVPLPVAKLCARVVLVREVPAETSLGYGATYTSGGAERWATLGIGYGDGLPRLLSPGGGCALLRGRRAPIIGRISMDVTVVDVTHVPDAAEGDVATLIGRSHGAEITLDEVAERCGTISYEILTGLTPRLPRVYLGAAGAR